MSENHNFKEIVNVCVCSNKNVVIETNNFINMLCHNVVKFLKYDFLVKLWLLDNEILALCR